MKYRLLWTALITFILTAASLTSSLPAFEKPLKTEKADSAEVKGTFTLILYGGRSSDDLETLAILDAEGDQYHFEPFAPDFDFKVKKGIQSEQALSEAQKFVSFHNAFWRSQLIKILGPDGKIIGYELRPLYNQLIYGKSDVMDIYYWLKKNGEIKVTIRLMPDIVSATRFPGGDGSGAGGSGH